MSTYALDAIDLTILRHLQANGRRSFTEIAQQLDVSVGTVRNRVTRLREAGVLRIIGWVDPLRVGYPVLAQVQVAVEPPEALVETAAAVGAINEVSFVAMTTGAYDLTLIMRCRDVEHLAHMIQERIHPIAGVVRTQTNIYLKVFKYGPSQVELPADGAAPA